MLADDTRSGVRCGWTEASQKRQRQRRVPSVWTTASPYEASTNSARVRSIGPDLAAFELLLSPRVAIHATLQTVGRPGLDQRRPRNGCHDKVERDVELNTGDLVDGKYRIVRLLGEGGMGAVYEGENTRIHRRVAIKVLHAGVAASADAVARFEREAQAAGRIGSEHIVEVLDLGQLPDGDRYMVMEFLDGQPLSARIRQLGRLSAEQLYPIALQMLEGLQAAHQAGIIHRDLKPDNVYLVSSRKGQADFVKLLDFGISKFSKVGGEFSMTRTGAVMGTPYYMAPEQAKGGKDIDIRVDIYAAGVILYEAVSGQVPFNADTFNELLFKIVLESPPPVEQVVPGLDPAFAAIIAKAMAREVGDRFSSCQEFQQALVAWGQARQGAPAAAPMTIGAATPGTIDHGTAAAWANTRSDAGVPIPKAKSKTPLYLALGAAAVLLVGGGVATAVKLSSDSDQATQAAALAEQERLEAERKAKEELKRLEREKLEAERRAAEERAKVEEQAKKLAQAEEDKSAEATKTTQAEVTAARQPPKPPPRKVAPVAPKVTSKQKGGTSSKTSTGSRQIRTSL